MVLGIAGCGGQGSTPESRTPIETPNSYGTAQFDVDLTTGQVTVIPLQGDQKAPKGRAVFTGGAIGFETEPVVSDGGTIGRRIVRVRATNKTNETIGGPNGVRMIFSMLTAIGGPGVDFRPQTRVETVTGTGTPGREDGSLTSATVDPTALATLSEEGFLIGNRTRLRVARNGQVSTLRSFGLIAGVVTVRNPTTGAEFAFVSDATNHRVQAVNIQTGTITSTVGTGTAGDSVGVTTQFNQPQGLAVERVDAGGGSFVVADRANNKVKRVSFTWTGNVPVFSTSVLRASGLNQPTGVAVNERQTLAVTEVSSNSVTLYPNGGSNLVRLGTGIAGVQSGSGGTAQFDGPRGVVAVGDTFYVANRQTGISAITAFTGATPLLTSSYSVALIAGNPPAGFLDGPGDSAQFSSDVAGIAAEPMALLIADAGNARVRRVFGQNGTFDFGYPGAAEPNIIHLANATGFISNVDYPLKPPYIQKAVTLAPGQPQDLGAWEFTVPANVTRFVFTLVVEADSEYKTPLDSVVNQNIGPGSPNNYVRNIFKVSSLVLDGRVGTATVGEVRDIAVDASGDIYIAERDSIRRYDVASQKLTTLVRGYGSGLTTDGDANTARLHDVLALAVSPDGARIYFIQGNHVLRVVHTYPYANLDEPSFYSVNTIYGKPDMPGSTYGSGIGSLLDRPADIALSPQTGDITLYQISQSSLMRIRFNNLSPGLPGSYYGDILYPLVAGPLREIAVNHNGQLAYTSASRIFLVRESDYVYEELVTGQSQDQDTSGYTVGAALLPDALALDDQGAAFYISRGNSSSPVYRVRRSQTYVGTSTVAGGGTFAEHVSGDGSRIRISNSGTRNRGALTPSGDYIFFDGSAIRIVQRAIQR